MGQSTHLRWSRVISVAVALPALVLTACGGGGSTAPTARAPITTTTAPEGPPTPFTATDAHFSAVFPIAPTRSASSHTVDGVTEPIIAYEADTTTEKLDLGYVPLPAVPDAASVGPALDASITSGSPT